ncbi:hypothetical protein DFA_08687 [Cavenderia fasciculata]|uniref:Uncharacterized protein n=1 Tax=Cavenderia fasciculata TaxID=261658 RepID=F4Q3N3_CACFS|nr:uncharacterized protein DFA_08687 [Cavenderia fasciculata]EGG17691.1 hypothetical protein DFA_08687 [Cavenderia fasciculata]|eukprot:XP_004356175.1 hypothetical protein DFA_08687 [Cavenderia fasciculata]
MAYRITLDHIKEDIRNIERLEENDQSTYLNELIYSLNNNNSNNNSDIVGSGELLSSTTNNKKDIFDFILQNVDLTRDIDNEYQYVKEIVGSLKQQSSLQSSGMLMEDNPLKDNSKLINDPSSTSSPTSGSPTISSLANSQEIIDSVDISDKSSSSSSSSKLKPERVILKKLDQLQLHNDTFKEAFRFIETNKWIQTKGVDLIDNDGELNTQLTNYITILNDSINQLNILKKNQNNNGKVDKKEEEQKEEEDSIL